ncbi:coagulation factor IIIa isoform X2 [Hypomesus transpacificus]|uniref:coagulation factor IIIa isoform X2 n=1 Tax=Hypomesus transpacificus TaxID=137520 RepID=UPI001F0857E5|nr:coagulation factor IIIa isoform X2 [Hypomesus transpacificus]
MVFLMTLFMTVLLTDIASGEYPKAQNVSWSSFNFKTLLMWSPKPVNYSYTVEYSVLGQDRQRNPHCIRTTETECDLTTSLTDLKATYSADVLSEPPLGGTSDIIEFPHTSSERFCPYKDTQIGRPEVKVEVSEDKRKITLHVKDPLTALFRDSRALSIRDVFAEDLQYRVTYRRAQSTGKKVTTSESSVIELTDVDRGQSYCFNVQAFIPSRSPDQQLGELSQTVCSQDEEGKPFFEATVRRIPTLPWILWKALPIPDFA